MQERLIRYNCWYIQWKVLQHFRSSSVFVYHLHGYTNLFVVLCDFIWSLVKALLTFCNAATLQKHMGSLILPLVGLLTLFHWMASDARFLLTVPHPHALFVVIVQALFKMCLSNSSFYWAKCLLTQLLICNHFIITAYKALLNATNSKHKSSTEIF